MGFPVMTRGLDLRLADWKFWPTIQKDHRYVNKDECFSNLFIQIYV